MKLTPLCSNQAYKHFCFLPHSSFLSLLLRQSWFKAPGAHSLCMHSCKVDPSARHMARWCCRRGAKLWRRRDKSSSRHFAHLLQA